MTDRHETSRSRWGNRRTVLDAKVLDGVGKYRESGIIGVELATKEEGVDLMDGESENGGGSRRTLRCSYGRTGLLVLLRVLRPQVHDYPRSRGDLEGGSSPLVVGRLKLGKDSVLGHGGWLLRLLRVKCEGGCCRCRSWASIAGNRDGR